jgi:DedD protein
MHQEPEGVSTRYLLGAFFAVVLLCAVFFSLGYFLGYREGHSPGAPLTERVAASSDAPAPVNPPSSGSSATEPEATQPASPSGAESSSGTAAAAPDSTNSAPGDAASRGGAQTPAVMSPATPESQPSSTVSSATPSTADSNAPGATDEGELTPRSVPSGLLIQVGAVTSRQQAFNMEETLRSKGFPALVLTPQQVRATDSFFRVVAGPYKTREAASAAVRKLATEGYKPFIRQ